MPGLLLWCSAVQRLDCACCGQGSQRLLPSRKARFISGPPDRSYLFLPIISHPSLSPLASHLLSCPLLFFNLFCPCPFASRERQSTSTDTPCAILRPLPTLSAQLAPARWLFAPVSPVSTFPTASKLRPLSIISRALPSYDNPAVLFCLATLSIHFCSCCTKLARVRPTSNLFTVRLAQHPSQLPPHQSPPP